MVNRLHAQAFHRRLFGFVGLSGASGVMLGALGAHALSHYLDDSGLATYKTAVFYQLLHTLALLSLAIIVSQRPRVTRVLSMAAYSWMLGIVLFSASLYGLALGGPRWLGPITPVGGVLLIIGWLCLIVYAYKHSASGD